MNMTISLDIIDNHCLQFPHSDSRDQPFNYEKECVNEAKKRYKAFSQGLIRGIDEHAVFHEAFKSIQ